MLCCSVQVPLQLSTACAEAARKDPRSWVALAALPALRALLRASRGQQSLAGTSSALQQVQQSGLIKQLPAMMVAMAEDTAADANSSSSGSSPFSQDRLEDMMKLGRGQRADILMMFVSSLQISARTVRSNTPPSVGVILSLTPLLPAVMQLLTAAARFVEGRLRHLNVQQQQHARKLAELSSFSLQCYGLAANALTDLHIAGEVDPTWPVFHTSSLGLP